MAVVNQTIKDTRWKTIIKTTITGTNSDVLILDASALLSYLDNTSILNLAAINWSVNNSLTMEWDKQAAAVIAHLDGNGKMGGSDGFTAIPNNAAQSVGRGDIYISNQVAIVGFVVIVCHKVESVVGQGGGWYNG